MNLDFRTGRQNLPILMCSFDHRVYEGNIRAMTITDEKATFRAYTACRPVSACLIYKASNAVSRWNAICLRWGLLEVRISEGIVWEWTSIMTKL